MMQQYRCVKPFEWGGSSYMEGLFYTDRGGPEYEPFRRMASERVASGHFEKFDGERPGVVSTGTAYVIKKED